jgi:hypothetical protein
MEEHPGDTLGKRFLTFWGALAAIAAVAVLLGLYRWVAIPSDGKVNDGGASDKRLATAREVHAAQKAEYFRTVTIAEGKSVTLTPDDFIPHAAGVLSAQKAAPSAMKTPAAVAAEAAAVHDPNLSKFEGK